MPKINFVVEISVIATLLTWHDGLKGYTQNHRITLKCVQQYTAGGRFMKYTRLSIDSRRDKALPSPYCTS
ncbi:hypothetical protein [Microcoleus sp. herbarium2]|uniref:hypothetical protein n=1 Tax=Microcoleus sp. herbarium2 TaxID=3055433 RepID=UPI002FD07462